MPKKRHLKTSCNSGKAIKDAATHSFMQSIDKQGFVFYNLQEVTYAARRLHTQNSLLGNFKSIYSGMDAFILPRKSVGTPTEHFQQKDYVIIRHPETIKKIHGRSVKNSKSSNLARSAEVDAVDGTVWKRPSHDSEIHPPQELCLLEHSPVTQVISAGLDEQCIYFDEQLYLGCAFNSIETAFHEHALCSFGKAEFASLRHLKVFGEQKGTNQKHDPFDSNKMGHAVIDSSASLLKRQTSVFGHFLQRQILPWNLRLYLRFQGTTSVSRDAVHFSQTQLCVVKSWTSFSVLILERKNENEILKCQGSE